MTAVECVKIDKATGERVPGVRPRMKTPQDVPHKPHAWIEVEREPKPHFDPDTQRLKAFNRRAHGKWKMGWKVKNLNNKQKKVRIKQKLANSDCSMARAVEDLYDHIVNSTPIPQEVVDKIVERQTLRGQL